MSGGILKEYPNTLGNPWKNLYWSLFLLQWQDCCIFKNTYFVEHQSRVASFILLFRCGFIKFPYLLNTYRAWKDITNTVVAGQRIQAIPLDHGAYNQSQQLSSLIVLQLPVGVLMVRCFCFRVTKIFLFSKTFIIIPVVKGYLY